jgi:hypothetical protein
VGRWEGEAGEGQHQQCPGVQGAIEKVFEELPVAHCRNYLAGMQKRLSLVKQKGGRPIGR